MRNYKLLALSSSLMIVLQMGTSFYAADLGAPASGRSLTGLVPDMPLSAEEILKTTGSASSWKSAVNADDGVVPTTDNSTQAARLALVPSKPFSFGAAQFGEPSAPTSLNSQPLFSKASRLVPDTTKLALADTPVVSAHVEATAVDNVDAQIVRKEIEFMKFNTDFRMHYAGGGPWKGRRLTAYNIGASSLAVAGLANIQAQYYHYRSNPGLGLAHRGRLECGLMLVMLGYLVEFGGYSFEMAYDLLKDAHSVGQHWDAKSVRTRAAQLKADIDTLLAQRAQQVSAAGNDPVLVAEGKVLTDWRDLAIVDFTQLYMQSRGNKHVRDVAELTTIAIAGNGAFPGALESIEGVRHTNLKQVGGSGVGYMVSAGLLTGATQVIKYGAMIQNAHSQKEIDRVMGETKCRAADSLGKDLDQLNQVAMGAGVPPALQRRMKIYSLCKDLVVKRCGIMEREKAIAKNSYQEGIISTLLRGGPQIAFSTMILHAGYADTQAATAAFRVVAQAATVNTTSWSIWLLDAIQGGARAEIGNYKGRNAEGFGANYPILKTMESTL
jgi:hypothetical protein